MKKHVLPVVGLLAALAMAGCAGSGSGGGGPSASPTPAAAATTAPAGPSATMADLVENADVKQCRVFHGTASLPATKTLVLGVHNLDNKDPNRYFELPDNWEYPTDLHSWSGDQYFGSRDTSVGQRFRVELLIVDLTTVQAAVKAAKSKGWYGPDNPAGAVVAAHVTLHRVAGGDPACS